MFSATQIRYSYGIKVCFPILEHLEGYDPTEEKPPSDFNDLLALSDFQEVKRQLLHSKKNRLGFKTTLYEYNKKLLSYAGHIKKSDDKILDNYIKEALKHGLNDFTIFHFKFGCRQFFGRPFYNTSGSSNLFCCNHFYNLKVTIEKLIKFICGIINTKMPIDIGLSTV